MRTQSYFSLGDATSVTLQIDRTEEALFIYRPSRAGAAFKKFLRPACICIFCFVLFVFAVVTIREGFPPADSDAYFVLMGFPSMILLYLGLVAFSLSEKRLLRIDSSHIVFTKWYFGRGSIKRIERPEKLELCERTGMSGHWVFKGMSQATSSFPASPSEVVWLRKVLDEFEASEPRPEGRDDNRNFPVAALKESSRTIRSVLKTKEHNGKPLVRLEHPSEQHISDDPSAGLFVRCPICHAALPHENVWFEEAAGQCAKCYHVFQIGDMQERKPPKRCRITFREDETGLHLHQKPRHGNLLTIYLVGLTLILAALLYLVLPKETWLTILFELAFLQAMGGLLMGFALTLFFAIRTYHVHRYIDFGYDTVRFRTRWLFWQRCRTVARREVGLFYKWEPSFFGGVYIPYSERWSFYILATETEVPYLVSMVNRWLWRNEIKSRGCSAAQSPVCYISGLGEPEGEWQMFCPHCGRQFFGEEVNFAHRESLLHCPKCRQVSTLSEMNRFVLESVPGLSEEQQFSLPELPGLRAERKGDKLTIEYAPPPPTWRKMIEVFGVPMFFVLTCGGIFLVLVLAVDEGPRVWAPMIAMLAVFCPVACYGLLLLYDMYRSLYAGWFIQIDRYRLVIHRHYKGESESVSFERREIRRLYRNECRDMYPSPLLGRFPSLLCNEGRGGLELVLRDGTIEPLPSVPHDGRKHRYHCDRNCRWINYLNRALAGL